MTVAKVGRWGANLAVRIPLEVASAAGLTVGEDVDVDILDGDIVLRRSRIRSRAKADALAAMREILAERANHTLGGLSIRNLIDEGRK